MAAGREPLQVAQVGAPRCRASAIDGKVLAVCIANCIISLLSTCFYYVELHRFKEYPFFTAQLNSLMTATVAAAGLAAVRLPPCRGSSAHDDGHLVQAEAAADSRSRWPLWQLCLALALLLSLQITVEVAGIQRIGNDNLPPVLQQAVVPLSFVLSAVFLHTAYSRLQMLGAFLVIVGVSAGFAASMLGGSAEGSVDWSAAAWFLFSRVPQALSNVLGEAAFRGRGGIAWVFRITLYTKLFVFPANFLVAMMFSKAFNSDVAHDYAAGAACLLGVAGPSGDLPAACVGAWKPVLLFMVPGAAYLLSEFQVLQCASATTYFLLAAFQLPLQDALFALPWFRGDLHAFFHPILVVQIVIVAVGLAIYGLGAGAGSGGGEASAAASVDAESCHEVTSSH